MNVVISGPFGNGTLADEAVLAGLLKHLGHARNTVSVLSADPGRTNAIHGIAAIKLDAPGAFLSNKEAWKAMSSAHLFVLASGGRINAEGKQPARVWLAQLEHAQTAGLKTAVIGAGADNVSDARERARIQRLLHHCADAISTRDDASKKTVMGYGLNANRISSNGDPTLALLLPETARAPHAKKIAGIVLATAVPSRTAFGAEPQEASPEIAASARELAAGVLKSCDELKLFHDDTAEEEALAESIVAAAPDRIEAIPASEPIAELQSEMAGCSAVFSYSLHGLYFAAASRVPAAGIAAEPGAAEFLASLGLPQFAVDASPGAALAAMTSLVMDTETHAAAMRPRLIALKKKEAQNARMLELLVPRRVARERNLEPRERKPKRKTQPD